MAGLNFGGGIHLGGSTVSQFALGQGGAAAVVYPSFRDPTVNDDTAHGATANMYWLNTVSGALFKATSVGNGAAVWVNQNLSASLPLDGLASANVSAAYGLKKLRAAYAGNCCILKRESDSSSLTLGWSGNSVDLTGVAAFIAGTVGHVTTLYDQSGNSRDATQSVTADGPIFVINAQGGAEMRFGNQQHLDMASGVSITNPNLSITAVAQPERLYTGNVLVNLGGTGGGNEYSLATNSNATYKVPQVQAFDPWGIQTGPPAENGLSVHQVTQNAASGADIFCNEATTNVAQTFNTDVFTGGQIGKEDQFTAAGAGIILAVIIHTVKLSAANALDLRSRLYRQYSITPQRAMDNIVSVGDSIGQGSLATGFVGWQSLILDQMARRSRMVNQSVSGIKASDWNATTRFADYATASKSSTARKNVCIIDLGRNDIAGGATAAATWTSLSGVIGKADAAGFYVIVVTQSYFGSSFDAARLTLNASITSGAIAAGADAIIDMTTQTVTLADTIHPNDAGHATEAAYALTYVNAALA